MSELTESLLELQPGTGEGQIVSVLR